MKNNNIIQQMSLSGLFVSMSISLGYLGIFNIFGNGIYLIAVPLFISTFFLNYKFCLITTISSVFMADLLTGWLALSWISVISYSIGISLMFILSKSFKNKFLNILSMVFSSLLITLLYFILTLTIFSIDYSIKMTFSNLIQFSIVIAIASPVILIVNILKK